MRDLRVEKAAARVMETSEDIEDNVHSPAHYQQGYIETIYAIAQTLGPEGFKAYCLGNWMKYKSRAAHKGGEEDLKKAEVYLGWAANGLPELNQKGCDALPEKKKANRFELSLSGMELADYVLDKVHRVGDRTVYRLPLGTSCSHIVKFDKDRMVAILNDGKELPWGSF